MKSTRCYAVWIYERCEILNEITQILSDYQTIGELYFAPVRSKDHEDIAASGSVITLWEIMLQ